MPIVNDRYHVSSRTARRQFAVVFAGARDHYQVAIALAERGRLFALINELYFPSLPPWVRAAIGVLDRKNRRVARSSPELPAERVKTSCVALMASLLRRASATSRFVQWQDRALGHACGKLAKQRELSVLAYSYYASYAFEQMPLELLRIIFQVHPHPLAAVRILQDEIRLGQWARESLVAEHERYASSAGFERQCREAHQAHFCLTPSTFAKGTLAEAGVPAERITVVPYGIDRAAFPPKSFSISRNQPLRLIFVGALVQRKGLGYVLAAMRQLRREPIELTLIGRGARDEALLAHFSGVPYRLIWNATQGEVSSELSKADVLVFPSLFDSFAHVILEGMAVGLPVITTTNTAGPDLLDEGRTGFIGPIRSVEFVTDKIRWFLENRDVIPAMGRSCQKEAERRTWQRFRAEIGDAVEQFERQWLKSK